MENKCIKTSLESLIWSTLLFQPINLKIWENFKSTPQKDQSLLDQEKNAGPSPSPDLPEFTLKNSTPLMINYKEDSGVTTSSMLNLKNGEKKTKLKMEAY